MKKERSSHGLFWCRNASVALHTKGQLVVFKAALADCLPDHLADDDEKEEGRDQKGKGLLHATVTVTVTVTTRMVALILATLTLTLRLTLVLFGCTVLSRVQTKVVWHRVPLVPSRTK